MCDVCGGHYAEPGVVARQRLSTPTYSHHPRPTPKPPCELTLLLLMAHSFFLGYPARHSPSMAHCSTTCTLILIPGYCDRPFSESVHVNDDLSVISLVPFSLSFFLHFYFCWFCNLPSVRCGKVTETNAAHVWFIVKRTRIVVCFSLYISFDPLKTKQWRDTWNLRKRNVIRKSDKVSFVKLQNIY